MINKETLPAVIGIVLLSTMFLMGTGPCCQPQENYVCDGPTIVLEDGSSPEDRQYTGQFYAAPDGTFHNYTTVCIDATRVVSGSLDTKLIITESTGYGTHGAFFSQGYGPPCSGAPVKGKDGCIELANYMNTNLSAIEGQIVTFVIEGDRRDPNEGSFRLEVACDGCDFSE